MCGNSKPFSSTPPLNTMRSVDVTSAMVDAS